MLALPIVAHILASDQAETVLVCSLTKDFWLHQATIKQKAEVQSSTDVLHEGLSSRSLDIVNVPCREGLPLSVLLPGVCARMGYEAGGSECTRIGLAVEDLLWVHEEKVYRPELITVAAVKFVPFADACFLGLPVPESIDPLELQSCSCSCGGGRVLDVSGIVIEGLGECNVQPCARAEFVAPFEMQVANRDLDDGLFLHIRLTGPAGPRRATVWLGDKRIVSIDQTADELHRTIPLSDCDVGIYELRLCFSQSDVACCHETKRRVVIRGEARGLQQNDHILGLPIVQVWCYDVHQALLQSSFHFWLNYLPINFRVKLRLPDAKRNCPLSIETSAVTSRHVYEFLSLKHCAQVMHESMHACSMHICRHVGMCVYLQRGLCPDRTQLPSIDVLAKYYGVTSETSIWRHFYERYKRDRDLLESDVVFVAHPAWFFKYYLPFNKSIILMLFC